MEQKQIISRKDARAAGIPKYFTGVPCQPRGHVCYRYTCTGHCQECDRINCKSRRLKKKEIRLAKDKSAEISKKRLATPIPAPNWLAISHSPTSIADRARQYRQEYILRKTRIK